MMSKLKSLSINPSMARSKTIPTGDGWVTIASVLLTQLARQQKNNVKIIYARSTKRTSHFYNIFLLVLLFFNFFFIRVLLVMRTY